MEKHRTVPMHGKHIISHIMSNKEHNAGVFFTNNDTVKASECTMAN